MKIFLSYHHDDNKLAGKIKHYIEREYGINVFLAHEDISPTQEWRERIIHELESCDVFIGLLTESYKESEWTDQETGFALARGIYMISVNAGLVPYGFLSKYQQLKIDSQSTYASCKEIAKLISMQGHLQKAFLNSVISVFSESESYARSEITIDILMECQEAFSPKQKNEIIRLATKNPQIHECYKATKILNSFIEQNESDLNSDLVELFKSNQQ